MNVRGIQVSRRSASMVAGVARLAGTATLVRLDEVVGRWLARASDRRAIGRLDDRMLGDIGLSRYDVESEARKPFWRG